MGKKATKKLFDENGVEVTEEYSNTSPTVIVQNVNPALTKGKEDNERINKLNAEFRGEVASSPMVKWKPPKFYAEYLGKIYHYTLNNYDVIVRFDGTEQKFPAPIYNHLMQKLGRILESHTTNELEYDEL